MKSRASLRITRRRQKPANPSEENAGEDDAFAEVGSPTPRASRVDLASPITPKMKPLSKRGGAGNKSLVESPGHEILSQQPTPSKWSSLLPDYFSSQMEGVSCDVLWDCSSPDAIRHLRRRRKDDNSVKEFVKYFKGPTERKSILNAPPLLAILRSSLNQQKQGLNKNPKKAKRSSRRRKQGPDPHQQELLAKILCAVELRSESSRDSTEQGPSTGDGQDVTAPSETPALPSDGQNGNGEQDNSWDDDDLFDNSFVIKATQNPELFLDISGSSTPKCAGVKQSAAAKMQWSRMSQQTASLNGTGGLDFQNSGIIPPTLVPGGSKAYRLPNGVCGIELVGAEHKSVTSGHISAARACQNNLLSPIHCDTFSEKRSIVESPRSQFRFQGNSAKWPKQLLSPMLQQSDQKQTGELSNSDLPVQVVSSVGSSSSARLIPKTDNKATTKQGSSTQHTTNSATGDRFFESRKQESTSGHKSGSVNLKQALSGCSSSVQSDGHCNAKQSAAGHSRQQQCRPDFRSASTGPQSTGVKSTSVSSSLRKPLVSVPNSNVNNHSVDKNAFDDSFPEDLLLKLAEQDESFESQVIQEFPTQAPKKPVCSLSKPLSTALDDFDDMDCDVLSSICEFDSFSESPQKGRNFNQPSVSVTKRSGSAVRQHGAAAAKYGPSESKQPRLYGNAAHNSAGVSAHSTNVNKKYGLIFEQRSAPASRNDSKETMVGKTAGNVSNARFTACNQQSSKPAKPTASACATGIVYPPSTGHQYGRLLATVAINNTTSNRSTVAMKKFSFKPAVNGKCVQPAGSTAASVPPANVTAVTDSSCADAFSQAAEDGYDDLLADALFESQIIAMLDQVESQASQQVPENPPPSPPKTSPIECSQEEIEKKRQAAMARRLRSALGKPP